ncbi:MAG TPA: hypothetical protein VM282_19325 [Acidimicrobiales bacterium]|nr:hypothetical protein [Acidimicrobiales bacterium]
MTTNSEVLRIGEWILRQRGGLVAINVTDSVWTDERYKKPGGASLGDAVG